MQLAIHKNKLKEITGTLKNSLSKGGIKPIFEHFLFDLKDNVLTVKATDTKMATIFTTPFNSEDTFSFTISGNTLVSLLASLDGENVVFTYNSETNDVTLTCDNYSLDASSANPQDFPAIRIPEDLTKVKLPDNFVEMLKSVSFSIGNDISKKDLNSLCMDLNKDNSGKLSLISTDRIRLSYSTASIGDVDPVRFVIPKNSVNEIEKLEPTHLCYGPDKQRAYFFKETEIGTYIFQTVLTNAVYPDIYTYLTDAFDNSKNVTMKRRDMLRVLKRIRLTSDKLNKSGTMDFSSNSLVMSALSASNKSKEAIEIEAEAGIPDSLNINIDYVMDYLNQETLDDIKIKVIDNSCLVFDKENYRHVLAVNS